MWAKTTTVVLGAEEFAMTITLKQDRTRKGGYRGSMNIQDMEQPTYDEAFARKMVMWNIKSTYGILSGNLAQFGYQLPAEMRSALAVVVANLEGIIERNNTK